MNIDQLVQTSYRQHDDRASLIREILEFLFEEKMPTSEAFDWSMIPEIPVSEIGWSDVRTQEGQEVAGPQRKLLEDYLNNIVPEGTLEQKLSALSTFMKDGYKTIAADSGSPADTVKNVMSYLVFYKTLTRVITNFNASSAGFSFESFLATLLGGTQISTGGGTIADFITGDGEYVSLKLYSESGVEVGGSFSDLVDDLNNPQMDHRMKYIVVLKRLKGKDLDQKGLLSFYTFTFTLDNVADIIAASSKGSTDCIKLPLVPDPDAPPLEGYKTGYRLAIDDPEGIPGRVKVTPEELNTHYQDLARRSLAAFEEVLPGITDSLLARPEFDVTERDEFVKDAVKAIGVIVRDQYADSEEALDILNKTPVAYEGKNVPLLTAIARTLRDVWFETEKFLKKDPIASRKAKIADILPSLKDSDVKLSQAWYNAQTDPEVKMRALKVSNGYLNTLHFKMGKSLSTTPDEPTFAVPEGQIFIGAEYIAPMIEGVRDILNDEVYSIFSSLKMLSTNLNEFFATGLRDGEKAQVAMTSADNIEKKTAKSVKKFGAKK